MKAQKMSYAHLTLIETVVENRIVQNCSFYLGKDQ